MKSNLLLLVVFGLLFPFVFNSNFIVSATSNLGLNTNSPSKEFPTNGSCIGLQSEYGSSVLSLTWAPDGIEYPDIEIIESSISIYEMPFQKEYRYVFTNDFGNQFVPESPGWEFQENTFLSLECSWENDSEKDMMDFGLYCGSYGVITSCYCDDEVTDWSLATAGGSPEKWEGTLPAAGCYWLRILNFAGKPNSGTIKVFAKQHTIVLETHVKSATVEIDTFPIDDGEWWLTTTAKDSLGNVYSHSVFVNIINHENTPSFLTIHELSRTMSGQEKINLTIKDVNLEKNEDKRDDHPLFLDVLYVRYELPEKVFTVVSKMAVTDLVGEEITILWDTRQYPNTAYGTLKFILFDGNRTNELTSNEYFEVWNPENFKSGEKSVSNIIGIDVFLLIICSLFVISKKKSRN